MGDLGGVRPSKIAVLISCHGIELWLEQRRLMFYWSLKAFGILSSRFDRSLRVASSCNHEDNLRMVSASRSDGRGDREDGEVM